MNDDNVADFQLLGGAGTVTSSKYLPTYCLKQVAQKLVQRLDRVVQALHSIEVDTP